MSDRAPLTKKSSKSGSEKSETDSSPSSDVAKGRKKSGSKSLERHKTSQEKDGSPPDKKNGGGNGSPPKRHTEETPKPEKQGSDDQPQPGQESQPTSKPGSPAHHGRQGRRRSSSIAAPPGSTSIEIPSHTRRPSMFKGRGSQRRGSQAFLMGDEIVLQFGDGKRRLSSFCTTSSNDETAVSMTEEPLTEDEVTETLHAHRSIIQNMRTQNWPMHRKLKVLRRAKAYIKKHEVDRKQSKQAKDVVANLKSSIEKTINRCKRGIADFMVTITPWEMRIKKIESHFGSVVASYFVFLRWVFWVNLFISVFICAFLMVPEILRGVDDGTGMRKEVEDANSSLKLSAVWEFEGYLKYSPIFYGYYSNREYTEEGYRLPLAYFLTTFMVYMFSFFIILRKMAANARMSRTSSKDDEYTFTWKLFTGWDFMIGNGETAYNKIASIVMGFKESILEEKEKKKEEKSWKRTSARVLANILVFMLLGSSMYGVILVVERSQVLPEDAGWFRANEVTVVVSGIGMLYPNIFDIIALLENYHPKVALRWQLARIMILNFVNLYTLMFSLFGKVDTMVAELTEQRINISIINRNRQETIVELEALIDGMDGMLSRSRREALDDLSYRLSDPNFLDLDNLQLREFHGRTDDQLPDIGEGRMFSLNAAKPTPSKAASTKGDMIEGRGKFIGGPSSTSTTTSKSVESKAPDGLGSTVTKPTIGFDPGGTSGEGGSTITTVIYLDEEDLVTDGNYTAGFNEYNETIILGPDDGNATTTVASTTRKGTTYHTNGRKYKPTPPPDGATTVTGSVTPGRTTTSDEYGIRKGKVESYQDGGGVKGSDGGDAALGCDSSTEPPIRPEDLYDIPIEVKNRLKSLCWETMFGQELAKLTLMDLVFTVISTILGDYIRAVVVRYCNNWGCFCWDLEKGWPGYGDFKIAENILHLVNNQGMVWLGMFFSPGLPAINTVKLVILMYIRSWAVITSNIPHETVFKASRNNNFYFALLLLMLFTCVLPVAYAVVWLDPSWHCGPFSGQEKIYHVLTGFVSSKLPPTINAVMDYLSSPGAVIPLLLLLILTIYYLMSMIGSLKDANMELKQQLRKDKDTSDQQPVPPGVATAINIEPPPSEGTTSSDHPPGAAAAVPTEVKKHVRIQEDNSSTDASPVQTDKSALLASNKKGSKDSNG